MTKEEETHKPVSELLGLRSINNRLASTSRACDATLF